jgi:hypothetical protein
MAKNLEVPGEDAIGLFSRFNTGTAIPARGRKMATGDLSAMFGLAMARKDVRLMIGGNRPASSFVISSRRPDSIRGDECVLRGTATDLVLICAI